MIYNYTVKNTTAFNVIYFHWNNQQGVRVSSSIPPMQVVPIIAEEGTIFANDLRQQMSLIITKVSLYQEKSTPIPEPTPTGSSNIDPMPVDVVSTTNSTTATPTTTTTTTTNSTPKTSKPADITFLPMPNLGGMLGGGGSSTEGQSNQKNKKSNASNWWLIIAGVVVVAYFLSGGKKNK